MHIDLRNTFWLDRWLPSFMRPYARLARWDRPIGILLLLYPSLWGLALAFPKGLPLKETILFIIGATLMRGAGCTYNDIIDYKYDKLISRTASRPIPSDQVTKQQALLFLLIQLMISFFILIALSPLAILIGIISIIMVALYPWMKRWTYWPQAFLGLTFNWGVLLGWAVYYPLSLTPMLFYISGIFWTLSYDTIYAHQDRKDDLLIGVKSTAIILQERTYPAISLFSLIMISLLIIGGKKANLNWTYMLAITFVIIFLLWQLFSLKIDNPNNCLRLFKSNHWIGLIVLIGILIGKY